MHIAAEVCGEVEIFKLREAAAAHPCAARFVWELEVPPKKSLVSPAGSLCLVFADTMGTGVLRFFFRTHFLRTSRHGPSVAYHG